MVTGIIAQHYTELINSISGGNMNKNRLIEKPQEKPPDLITIESNRLNFIKEGTYYVKQS